MSKAVFVVVFIYFFVIAAFIVRAWWSRSDAVKDRQTPSFTEILNSITPMGATIGILIGLFQYLDNQRQTSANDQRTEYIRAIQLLGDNNQRANMDGITSLAQLANDSSDRHWLMVETLSTFVRSTSSLKENMPEVECSHGNNKADARTTLNRRPNQGRVYHCATDNPDAPESRYNFEAPNQKVVPSLFERNPPAQAALKVLGTRNLVYEEKKNLPDQERFRYQFERANPWLCQAQRNEITGDKIVALIEQSWVLVARKDSPHQLINEVPKEKLTMFPKLLSRPWVDLSGSDLAKAAANSLLLDGIQCTDCDLSLSDFNSIRLAKANLARSFLLGTQLFNADLREAFLQSANFEAANLGKADLRNSYLVDARFFRANFWRADLSESVMVSADMSDLETMSGANMNHVIGFRAHFDHAKIAGDGQYKVCMDDAYLKEASFVGADLRSVSIRRAKLDKAIFTDADLTGADLSGTDLSHVCDLWPEQMALAIVDNDKRKLPEYWTDQAKEDLLRKSRQAKEDLWRKSRSLVTEGNTPCSTKRREEDERKQVFTITECGMGQNNPSHRCRHSHGATGAESRHRPRRAARACSSAAA